MNRDVSVAAEIGDDVYKHYTKAYGWTEAEFGYLDDYSRQYFHAELSKHGFECKGKRVLELGFGNGAFLRFAKNNGADVVGVEVQRTLVERAHRAGFEAHSDPDAVLLQHGGGGFGLIVAYDVMEHLTVDQAIAYLHTFRKLIDPERGMLIARFPNGDSPFSAVYQNGDHTHRTYLGQGLVAYMLAVSGWRLDYLGESATIEGGFSKRLGRTFKSCARGAFEGFLRLAYYGKDGPPSFGLNYLLVARPTAPMPGSITPR